MTGYHKPCQVVFLVNKEELHKERKGSQWLTVYFNIKLVKEGNYFGK